MGRVFGILAICFVVGLPLSKNVAAEPTPPATSPASGFGSVARESCRFWCESRWSFGSINAGTKTWVFTPRRARGPVPVVIYLHGFFALVPDIYLTHIHHLTRQGYAVIFPQFQKGLFGLITDVGIFAPADQQTWLDRAIAQTDRAVNRLGSSVDLDRVYLFGHSLGATLGVGWEASGGLPLAGMVLANPQIDPTEGLPDFVAMLVDIIPLEWESQAAASEAPVMILTGEDDVLAPPGQAVDVFDALVNAPSRVVYQAQTDRYGAPALFADHFVPMTNGGLLELLNPLIEQFGGRIEMTAYDRRYYHAALDAMLDGFGELDFDLGAWSDGRPVAPVVTLAP